LGQLAIRVQPGARRTRFAGWYGDLPKLAVAAAPVDDAANDEVVAFLAGQLEVRARSVTIVGGRRSRTKRLAIEGLDDTELMTRVVALNPRPSR
jgi:uncharacterized protein YggU (UPF0235/DUF167 family)